ncbi:MAG: hypothetical protein ACTSPG_05885, partial [Candidatus Hodarchaeales archaeon]
PLPFTSPVPSFDDFQVSHFLVFLITLTGGVQQFRRNLREAKGIIFLFKSLIRNQIHRNKGLFRPFLEEWFCIFFKDISTNSFD